MNGIAVLLLTALLILGSAGWGLLFQVQLKKFYKDPSEVLTANYLQIPIGISLFLLVFGWLVALDVCSMWGVLLWHFFGSAQLVVRCISSKSWKNQQLTWPTSLINVIILAVCSVTSLGIVVSRTFQKMDDLPAYAYLAQKLVATGGLIDPFSSRRILSYGGATLYQAVFVKFTGLQSIFAFDNLFIPVVLVITLLLFGKSHKLNPWLLGLLSLCLVAGTSSLILFNLSPRFAATFFTLIIIFSSYEFTRKNYASLAEYAILMGLFIAVIATMRIENCIAPAVVVSSVIFWNRKSVLRHFALMGLVILTLLSGWAIALFRSSGTFLFPLMRGTSNMSFYFDSAHWGLGKYFTLLWDGIALENQFAILAALLVSALCIYLSVKKDMHLVRVLLFVAAGVIVQLVAMVLGMTGYDGATVARYFGPTILASGLFTISLLLIMNTKISSQEVIDATVVTKTSMFFSKNVFALGAVFLIFLCSLGYPISYSSSSINRANIPLFSTEFKTTLSNVSSYVHKGALSLLNDQQSTDPVSQYVSGISNVNSAIPKSSKVLAAIEAPGLLDMKKFSVITLDWPGANSLHPGIPLNEGVNAFTKYLLTIGIRYVVIQLNDYSTIYDSKSAHVFVTSTFGYKSPGEAVLHWDSLKSKLLSNRNISTRYFSGYALIDLRI
jgi:hypothetical protein